MASLEKLALAAPTAPTVPITKSLAELSRDEIAAIRRCCLRGGMMIVMMDNLVNGTIASPSGIRIAMHFEGSKLVAWFLMDCVGEYNQSLGEGCSIHFYTAFRHRRRGLASALFESQLELLRDLRCPLVAYVMNGDRRADFYRRLADRHGIAIQLTTPHLYLPRYARAV